MAAGLIPATRSFSWKQNSLFDDSACPHATQVLGIVQAHLVAGVPGIYTAPSPQHPSLLSRKTQYLISTTHLQLNFLTILSLHPFFFIYIIFKMNFPHFTHALHPSLAFTSYLEINFSQL